MLKIRKGNLMKFKKIMSTLFSLSLACSLVACGAGTDKVSNSAKSTTNSGSTVGTASKSENEKTKLTFLRVGTEPEKKEYWENLIKEYISKHPNIEIEYQEAGYGDDFETKLNTGFASGTAPDIINFTMASMGTRVPLGQYAALDEYVNKWEGKDDFMDNALKLGTINGKIYGIATFPDPRILVYNKEMFKEAGLDPNKPPTTWDELLEYHKKLVKKDGDTVVQTGFGVPTSGTNMQHYLSVFAEQNGLKNLIDEDDNTILFNRPEAIEAAAFLKEIADAGIIKWDSNNREQNPFATGMAAMTLGNTSEFYNYNKGGLEGKLAMAAPTSKVKQATFCGMGFMFMSGETKYKDEVWDFIAYVASAEEMWNRYEKLGVPPLRKSLEKKFVDLEPENNKAIYDSINTGTGSPKVAYANSVYNTVNDAMEKVMYGVASPKEALDEAAETIKQEINNQ